MSAEKARLTFSSAGRRSQGIFTLSNVFFNRNSSCSPGKINNVSFERNGFMSPIGPIPAISCFREVAPKTAQLANKHIKAAKSSEKASEQEVAEEEEEAIPEFNSEFENLSLDEDAPAPTLRFTCKGIDSSPGRLILLKNLMRIGENFPSLSSHKSNRRYVCKYCGDIFASGCAMGGHISKVHRGCSQEYRKKRIKSKAKKNDRERARFLRKAFKPKPRSARLLPLKPTPV